ncbi:MAG TPA: protein kinase [Pyrinomonadaceae bacterium]|nr:protein kinase [Pyrinomonadaceae bacterium]
MIETGTLLQNRYLIERQIGAGGMGAVYLAVDERFGSNVAIKETFYKDADLRDAFEREARLLNSLHHPVLPHVSDYFTDSNGLFLVMEYIDGEDLSEIIKRKGAFAVGDVLRWMNSLLDALDFLHSQEPPIIHRDIKPHNLKITTRGDVILLDFGLAKLNSDDNSGALSVFGYSRKYSPLEQIQGTGTDARSDIFALGATAFHLLTGKSPVDVLTRAAEIVAGNNDPLQLASQINKEVPPDVAQVLNSALALNPAQRFVSAKAARQALDYAVSANSGEVSEEASEQASTEIQNEVVVLSPVETKDFPALESFTENVKSVSQTEMGNPAETKPISKSVVESPQSPVAEKTQKITIDSFNKDKIVEHKTPVNRSKGLWVGAAALIAILIGGGLSAGYFMNSAEATADSNQNSIVEQVPATNLPVGNISNTESNSNTESAVVVTTPTTVQKAGDKNKPQISPSPVEKIEDTPKVSEDPPARAASETPKPPAPKAQAPRPSKPQPQPRVSESARVPDIESVFTGQTSDDEDRRRQRQERRQRRLERREQELLTDDELEESRPIRRQKRLENRNRRPFPLF